MIFFVVIHLCSVLYSQCTTRRLLSRRGVGEVSCQTRQSSFLPSMLLSGYREYWAETAPLLEERLVERPFSSVSQERRGGGRAMERQVAAVP